MQLDGKSYIAMDAPPDKEDCHPFVAIAQAFFKLGLHVPEILHQDMGNGFLLLTDLGSRLYLQELNADTAERLYGDAMGALVALQACGPGDCSLPAYVRVLLINEMELFREWFLKQHLGLALDDNQQQQLDGIFNLLADAALEQPVDRKSVV